MKVEDLAQYILWGVSLIAFLGTAAMYLKGSADKGTITSLGNAVTGLEAEMKARDLEHARESREKDARIQAQDEKIAQQAQQIHSLGRELRILNGVVTQANEIAHLQATLEGHHGDAMNGVATIKTQLTDLHNLVRTIAPSGSSG